MSRQPEDAVVLAPRERLDIFIGRLSRLPRASSSDEALQQICDIFDEVEDEFSGVPRPLDDQIEGGRMRGPTHQQLRPWNIPGVARYRHRDHETFVADNGAIKIMRVMNEIERLRSAIEGTFSDAKTRIDEPQDKDGEWYLNVWCRGIALVIQWNEGGRFGVSTPTGDWYGEGADEGYPGFDELWERVRALFERGESTHVPETRLPSLRANRGLSQVDLAGRLRVKQSAISKLERREDMLVSTLSSVVAALGGTLEIRALFPDGEVKVLTLGDGALVQG